MPNPSVLVIDDDAALRNAVAEELKLEGYDLHFASNGPEGLSRLQQVTPTVIVLDLGLPVMDGHQFLSQLSLKPSDPYSVIALTEGRDAKAVKSCYNAGVSAFIKKPLHPFELRGVVRNAVAMKQLSLHLEEMVQERTAGLEDQLRELTALNRIFQKHLDWRSSLDAHFREIMENLQRVAADIGELAHRAQPKPSLDLPAMPSLESDKVRTNQGD